MKIMVANYGKAPVVVHEGCQNPKRDWLSLARYVKRLKNQPRVQVTPTCAGVLGGDATLGVSAAGRCWWNVASNARAVLDAGTQSTRNCLNF
jgi:hypothetical protein